VTDSGAYPAFPDDMPGGSVRRRRTESYYRRREGRRCLGTSRCDCRPPEPHHLVSHFILKLRIRKTSLSWSPVTESNRRPSPYRACRFRLMQSVGSDYRRSENVRCLSASRSSGAAWRRCHLICHWLKDLCSNWSPAGPNPIDDETYGLRADGRANATATTASPRPVRSQRVQPGRRRCPPVYGPPGELRLKSARERMDII
jgi:hypothetical protein